MMKKTGMPKAPKVGGGMKDAMAMPRFGARAMRPGGMKKGGGVHPDAAMDKKLIRKEIARAEKMEHKDEDKGMKKGGTVKKMALGGMLGNVPSQSRMQSQSGRGPTQSSMRAQGSGGAGALGGFRGPNLTLPPASAAGRPSAPSAEMERAASRMRMESAAGAMRNDMARAAQQAPRSSALANAQRQAGGMKKGGSVKMARGGGVEQKGKTKGRFI